MTVPDEEQALSIKREEVIAQVRARQARRSELRSQTGRLFVFLGVLVAFFATLIGEVEAAVDAALLGGSMALAVAPLYLIRRARGTGPHDIDLSAIATASARAANESLIREGERTLGRLDRDNSRAYEHLVRAEIATAIVAFCLFGVGLAVLPGTTPSVTSSRTLAAYGIVWLALVALVAWPLRPAGAFGVDRGEETTPPS